MKKTTTLLIIVFFTLGNILTANAKTYRATQTNDEGKTVTITLSDGDDKKVIEPQKQYRYKYDAINGTLTEKVVYYWNTTETKWIEHTAYNYEYNTSNQLVELQYSKWDNKELAWSDTEFSTYTTIGNEKLLTINYLDTIK